MGLFALISIFALAFLGAAALSEALIHLQRRRVQERGCTCLDAWHYHQDCPILGWPNS